MNRLLLQCALTLLLIAVLLSPVYSAASESTQNHAVILTYHRIGEDNLPDENLTIEQFTTHIHEIKTGGYNVLPLTTILEDFETGTLLPPHTIAITFDGAHKSALENAVPLLLKAKLPFTIFYAALNLDQEDPASANWNDLKKLAKNKNITLASLPTSYNHIAYKTRTEMLTALNEARRRHREEFGHETPYLAYPFGEYSLALKDLAKTQGFKAAFGLHSGAIDAASDRFALPRFSMTEHYGDLERFRLVTRAIPLTVTDIEPPDPDLKTAPFFTGFTLPDALASKSKNLSCFISGEGRAKTEILGNRIEIREDTGLLDNDRIRLNCTLPGPLSENDEPQWYWLGLLYFRSSQPDELQRPQEQNASTYSQYPSSKSP